MKGLTRKRLAAGVILLAALVLCGWLFGWWRGGTIDVLDFDAEEVESVSMSVARFGYWDPLVLTEKDEIQDVIDRLNGLDYTGKMVRHRLGYALQNNFFIGGCSVLYEFGFTFTDGTSRCLLMFPTDLQADEPFADMEVFYRFYEEEPRFPDTARGSLQFFYDYYAAYNGPVDEEALMEQYGG